MMIHNKVDFKPKIGDTLKNNNPYDGEGELIVAGEPDEAGMVKCIHACHTKHKGLNGLVELKPMDSLIEFYHKIK